MAMLGEEMQGRRGGSMGAAPGAPSGGAYSSGMGGAPAGQQPAGEGGTDAGNVVNPVNLLRGILGR
jgi:hypothetical protein